MIKLTGHGFQDSAILLRSIERHYEQKTTDLFSDLCEQTVSMLSCIAQVFAPFSCIFFFNEKLIHEYNTTGTRKLGRCVGCGVQQQLQK